MAPKPERKIDEIEKRLEPQRFGINPKRVEPTAIQIQIIGFEFMRLIQKIKATQYRVYCSRFYKECVEFIYLNF